MITNIRQTFLDFLVDEDFPIRLSTDVATSYITKGGPAITTKLLRMFVEFIAQSRTGLYLKANGALNVKTVHVYIHTLNSIFRRGQNPIEKEIKDAAHAWIDGYLLPKGMITTIGKDKHTCYDIDMILQGWLANDKRQLQIG